METTDSHIMQLWEHHLVYWKRQYRKYPKDKYVRQQLASLMKLVKDNKGKN